MLSKKVRILLLDDHPVVIYGLNSLLETVPEFDIVGVAQSAAQALQQIDKCQPDVVVADVSMPQVNGIDFLKRCTSKYPDVKVVMLTALEDEEMELLAFRHGASAYVYKSVPSDELINAIMLASEGKKVMTPKQSDEVLGEFERLSKEQQCEKWNLTSSDLRLLKCLSEGMTYAQTADVMHVSESTIKRMVASVITKMNATSRTHAVSLAIRYALI